MHVCLYVYVYVFVFVCLSVCLSVCLRASSLGNDDPAYDAQGTAY